jgi:hypothetical protein
MASSASSPEPEPLEQQCHRLLAASTTESRLLGLLPLLPTVAHNDPIADVEVMAKKIIVSTMKRTERERLCVYLCRDDPGAPWIKVYAERSDGTFTAKSLEEVIKHSSLLPVFRTYISLQKPRGTDTQSFVAHCHYSFLASGVLFVEDALPPDLKLQLLAVAQRFKGVGRTNTEGEESEDSLHLVEAFTEHMGGLDLGAKPEDGQPDLTIMSVSLS